MDNELKSIETMETVRLVKRDQALPSLVRFLGCCISKDEDNIKDQ